MIFHLSLEALTLSLIALAFIHIFYYLFKISWPEMYFAVSDSMSLYISFSPVRYFAFRIIPVLSIIAILLGTSKTLTLEQRIYAGLFIGIFHLLFTNFKALLKIFTNDKSVFMYLNKSFQIFTHIFTIAITLAISVIAGIISSWEKIQLITPSPEGLRDNLWSSVIAAMLGVWIYKLYQRNDASTGDLFNRNKEKINPKIIKTIENESRKFKANDRLVKAICIVENIQRPSWIRQLERVKSFLFKEGTYGIMQVKSNAYITDEESIKIAIEKFFSNTDAKDDWEELNHIVLKYNPDERYVEFVEHAFQYL
jgi:hypothetical protein